MNRKEQRQSHNLKPTTKLTQLHEPKQIMSIFNIFNKRAASKKDTTSTLSATSAEDAATKSSSSPPTTNVVPKYPLVGTESIMKRKAHGTSNTPVQKILRWGADVKTADRIANFNRHWAENPGYFKKTSFLRDGRKEVNQRGEITFYDSNTGKPLFHAPRGRTWEEFVKESDAHGWPSFRDEEVEWENVRCLRNGEAVSLDGTHLGHNLPDRKGNRYCINLVCVAGRPLTK